MDPAQLLWVGLAVLAYCITLRSAAGWLWTYLLSDRAAAVIFGFGLGLPALVGAAAWLGLGPLRVGDRMTAGLALTGPIACGLVILAAFVLELDPWYVRRRLTRLAVGAAILCLAFAGFAVSLIPATVAGLDQRAAWLLPLGATAIAVTMARTERARANEARGHLSQHILWRSDARSGAGVDAAAHSLAASRLKVAAVLMVALSAVGILLGYDRSIWWFIPAAIAFDLTGCLLAWAIATP